MAVFVDDERISWKGRRWCHLVADSLEELHQFADRLGLKRDWFQDKASYPHYDVTVSVRSRALRLGAQPADKAQVLACCRKLKAEFASTRAAFRAPLEQPIQEVLPWMLPVLTALP